MWKFFGALIGYLIAGLPGAVIGFFGGAIFQNSALSSPTVMGPFAKLDGKREQYFQSTFRLMGYIAKADGRISEEEIQLAQSLMQRMNLNADHKREAIAEFQSGAAAGFNAAAETATFVERCGRNSSLANMLLVTLMSTAFADARMDASETEALAMVAQQLGFSRAQFDQLLGMVAAQQGFARNDQQNYRQAPPGHSNSVSAIEQAYAALGVSSSVDDKALKLAYRKLISQHHPDKLIAQGLPDDMVAIATEKSQEIQAAYDLLEKHRRG